MPAELHLFEKPDATALRLASAWDGARARGSEGDAHLLLLGGPEQQAAAESVGWPRERTRLVGVPAGRLRSGAISLRSWLRQNPSPWHEVQTLRIHGATRPRLLHWLWPHAEQVMTEGPGPPACDPARLKTSDRADCRARWGESAGSPCRFVALLSDDPEQAEAFSPSIATRVYDRVGPDSPRSVLLVHPSASRVAEVLEQAQMMADLDRVVLEPALAEPWRVLSAVDDAVVNLEAPSVLVQAWAEAAGVCVHRLGSDHLTEPGPRDQPRVLPPSHRLVRKWMRV